MGKEKDRDTAYRLGKINLFPIEIYLSSEGKKKSKH